MKIHKNTPLPLSIAEMVSDFCFHSDILVTTNKNKLVGIYPDTARLHTVAEFSKSITGNIYFIYIYIYIYSAKLRLLQWNIYILYLDLAVANGNIHRVYVLMCREMQKTAIDCRDRLGCDGGDVELQDMNGNNGQSRQEQELQQQQQQQGNNNNNNNILSNIPSWIWEPKQHVDMMICEYDIAKGLLSQTSINFNFEQIAITTMQQLRGIYYKPSYRLLIDNSRDILVVSRDGDFITFDSKTLTILNKREIIAHPENRDDREQFIHLREYRWNASRIVPVKVVKSIINIVDQVEGTQSLYLHNSSDVYIVIPFGHHALFICNINTGWLRYLDFSHVDPISDTQIHYVEFSIDNQYLYLCCTQTLSVLSTKNFQPIITVPFTKLDYTMPCGLIRTPPTEDQILLMLNKHRQKLLKTVKSRHMNMNNNTPKLTANLSADPLYHDAIKSSQATYKQSLSKKLESIAVVFASTRIFMDPRIFLYRFPDNKSRVVSHGNGKQRSVYSGGSFLVDRVTNEAPSSGVGQQWHYISMKQQRPWNQYKNINSNYSIKIGDQEQKNNKYNNNNNNKDKENQNDNDNDKFVPILNRI